jgi:hypothetical protein
MLYLSYYLLCFLFNKTGEEEGGTGSAQMQGDGGGEKVEVAQTMYAHVSRCKDVKRKN